MTDRGVIAAGKRICVAILSTGDSESVHGVNELAQRETFAVDHDDSIRFIFVRGSDAITEPRFLPDERVLHVPVAESFDNILAKTILGVGWIRDRWSPDLILRTNNSSYFHLSALCRVAERLPPTNCYAGRIGYVDGRPFVSGAGLWLSKDVVDALRFIDVDRYSGIADDLAIADHLGSIGLGPLGLERNDVGDHDRPRPTYHTRCKGARTSEAAPMMRLVHRVYSSSDRVELGDSLDAILKHQRRNMRGEFGILRAMGASRAKRTIIKRAEFEFARFLGLDDR